MVQCGQIIYNPDGKKQNEVGVEKNLQNGYRIANQDIICKF